jgi:UDP-N-acetylglucosamine 3-dehydrogenase
LVGTSPWSDFMYLQNLRGFQYGEIVALAARNEVRLNELGKQYGITHLYTDWRELISSGEIDAIIVASPDRHHHEIVMAALAEGLHVMCEKPLAMNANDAGEMLDAAQNTGLIHNVMFTWRTLPMHKKVKELLEAGVTGEVYHFDIRFVMGWAHRPEYVWRLDAKEGNGAIGDLGVHDIDLTRWLLGEVATVYAETEHSVNRPDSVQSHDTATMLLELKSGAKGVITVSLVHLQGDRDMEQKVLIYGSEGSIEATLYQSGANQGMKVWVAHKDGPTEEFDLGTEMWVQLREETVGVRQFVENVALRKQEGPDFRDGYLAQLVVDAALESAAAKQRITL